MPATSKSAGVHFANDASSTTATSKVLAAAVAPADAAYADVIRQEPHWRSQYWRHFVRATELAAQSPAQALIMAEAGLAAARGQFEFVTETGERGELWAMVQQRVDRERQGLCPPGYTSVEVVGEAPFRSPALELPLGGRVLTGAALVRQVEAWVQQGTLEPSAGRALAALATDKAEWLDLRGRHFVLLGAGSAMGPAALLLRCGATVHAVDLPRPAVWRRLIAVARASPGRLVVPVRAAHGRPPPPGPGPDAGPDTPEWLTEHGGCDLLADAPAVAAWIATQAPSSPLVVGTYVYLDGALFARVAAASDAILAAVCAARGGARAAAGVTIAHLLSPTEAHVVPEEAAAAARARGQQLSLHSVWEQPIRVLSRERYLEPNRPTAVPQADGSLPPLRVQDSFVWQQGPNYAFAKQLQKWRAIASRAAGHVVSATVGPAAMTESVMHNTLLAAGMRGCRHFGIEPFEVGAAAAVLAGVLVWDLRSGGASAAHPDHPLRNPLELFGQNACHGGTWRSAFKTNSYAEVAALLYFVQQAAPWLATGAAAVAALRRSRL